MAGQNKALHEITDHKTRQSILWNAISMTLVHCWSWLLPVFMLLLQDQLSEPEIMLMFKDKLKVSDLGYQLEGKEEGSMLTVKLEGSHVPCVCSQSSPGSVWAGEGKGCQSLYPMVFLFCLTAAFLSQQLRVLCHTLRISGFICPFLSGKQEWFLFSDLVEKAS